MAGIVVVRIKIQSSQGIIALKGGQDNGKRPTSGGCREATQHYYHFWKHDSSHAESPRVDGKYVLIQ